MKKRLVILLIILILAITSGCKSDNDQSSPTGENSGGASVENSDQNDNQDEDVEEVNSIDVITEAWSNSPHSDTYVVDDNNQNNSCAQCHSPINWMISLDELPESCFVCKFEVDDPEPFVIESEWENIQCKTCHKFNKKGEVEEGIYWLEIAPLDQYADVESSTELCTKCHIPLDNVGLHIGIEVLGVHEGYDCDDCHDPHSTNSSCSDANCHAGYGMEDNPIGGHDDDHQLVSCSACHDADGLDFGPSTENIWYTFIVDGDESYPFVSHNLSVSVDCDDCHFTDNPWGLSESVE